MTDDGERIKFTRKNWKVIAPVYARTKLNEWTNSSNSSNSDNNDLHNDIFSRSNPLPFYMPLLFFFFYRESTFFILSRSINKKYCKIPKISPVAYIFQRPFLRGLSTEGNLGSKIDWASVIVWRKFTLFALFCCVLEGNFQVQALGGGGGGGVLYLEGRFNGGFFALRVWGAYIWRGLYMGGGGAYFRNFTLPFTHLVTNLSCSYLV